MKCEYRMYGSSMSYFAAKLRAYLHFKGLDFEEKLFSIYDVRWRLPKNVGSSGIPAMESNSGEWLSDTTDIIAVLEARLPLPPTTASSPVQQIASMLLEAWCDDSLLPAALHTRWFFPMLQTLVEGVNHCIGELDLDQSCTIPRFIKGIRFPMLESDYERDGLTHTLWMMQRIQSQYSSFTREDRRAVARWLSAQGNSNALEMDFGPQVTRDGLGVRPLQQQ